MGSLIKPLSAMTVATTQDGHAPTGGSGVRTQVANGATMSLKDWWNNTGKNLYTELVNAGSITTAPVKQEYTPSVTLSGVMDRANQIMGRLNTASPETQQAAVSAANNSSFNFDAPTFDPNAGKQEARDKMYSDYMTTLANSGKRRINMQKANKNFNEQFEQEWLNGEAGRRNQFNQQQRDKKMNALKQSFFDAANNFSINLQDDVNAAKEAQGLVMDPATGEWKSRTEGLDFNNTEAVQQWLMNNGYKLEKYGADNKYGTETNDAITAMLKDSNMVLSDKERQQFMNLQNQWNNRQKPTSSSNPPQVSQVSSNIPVVGHDPKSERAAKITRDNFLENNSRYFRNNLAGTRSARINGKLYPIVVTKNLGTGQTGNDQSYFLDPETGRLALAEEDMLGRVKQYTGTPEWFTVNQVLGITNNKQGGTLIKKHQQGGNMEDIQTQVKQLVQAVAAGDQQAAEQVKQIMQAAEQGDQQALQIAQMIQAEIESMKTSAKLGAKLNYIKQLKGDCLEGEELVYFKKGGMICSKCEKKHEQVVAAKGKKLNAVDEFKKARKSYKK